MIKSLVSEGKFSRSTYITRDTDLTADPAPFLVDGIIHESMTLLYGQTCSGKSTVAASLAIALANGEKKFLGRKVNTRGAITVGIVTGDPSGGNEYKRRIVGSKALGDNGICLNEPYRPTRPETWDEVHEQAEEQKWQFVIVDNLSSFVPGSLNEDSAIKEFYEHVEKFPRMGIPLLLVAHTSDKWSDHGPSRIPMGSSFIRFGPRWWINAYRYGGNLHLDFDGNEGTPHSIITTEPNGTPFFNVVRTLDTDEFRGQRRGAETHAKHELFKTHVLTECQALNGQETAQELADHFGGSKSSHATNLSKGAYGVKREKDRWVPTS